MNSLPRVASCTTAVIPEIFIPSSSKTFCSVFLAVERGLANVECDLEYTGRRIDPLSGVEEVGTGGQELRQTGGPNYTFTVNRQVVEDALCESWVIS